MIDDNDKISHEDKKLMQEKFAEMRDKIINVIDGYFDHYGYFDRAKPSIFQVR
jgi:hypothetical protein